MNEAVGRYGSIITRLTLVVTGILVTAVLIVGGLNLVGQYRQLHRALKAKAETLAQFMAQVAPLGMLSLNFVEMNNNVKKVVQTDNDAVYAMILNAEGVPLAWFFKEAEPSVIGQVRDMAKQRQPLAAVEAMKRANRLLEVAVPIAAGERRIGSAKLGFSTTRMRQAVMAQSALVGATLLIIIGLSIAVLRAVLQRILHPVQALTTAANQISSGDLQVALTGTDRADELGVLSRAFESMAGRLRGLIAGLERQLRFVETLLQTIPLAVFYKDAGGRYLGCNEEFTRITGVFQHEMAGKTVFELWPGELSETYHYQDLELLRHPAVQVYDFKIRDSAGKFRDVIYHKNVFLDETGAVAGIVGAILDITERKRAEEERRESDARYRRIVATATEGIWALGPDTVTTFVNDRMAEMIGSSVDEMLGRPQTDFMFAEDVSAHLHRMENRRRGLSESYECRFRRTDGEPVWALASSTPIFDDEDRFAGSFGMFADITKRKRAEDELHHLNEELEQRVRERTVELETKNEELARMNKLFVGRELRMVELKERIRELEKGIATPACAEGDEDD